MSILNLADLRTQVNNDIKTNGVRAITGNIMNVNLIDMIDSIESDYDGITGGLDSRLTSIETSALLILQDPSTGWDASVGTFPGGGTAKAGYYWNVSTAGTVDGIAFDIGDSLLAILDNASTGTYAANWSKKDDIDSVISVAGKVGAITLVASDITDFDVEVSNNTDVAANTAKVTNVSTDLSVGANTATQIDIESSDGTNATLSQATTLLSGLMSAAKFNEIVANNSKVSNVSTDLSIGTKTAATVDVNSSDGTNATVPSFTSTEAGLTPSSGGGTTNFLRADGSWAAASSPSLYTANGTTGASRTVTLTDTLTFQRAFTTYFKIDSITGNTTINRPIVAGTAIFNGNITQTKSVIANSHTMTSAGSLMDVGYYNNTGIRGQILTGGSTYNPASLDLINDTFGIRATDDFPLGSRNGAIKFSLGANFTNANTRVKFTSTGAIFGAAVGLVAASAELHVQGSGATAGTTALLVENSAGTDALKVLDDTHSLFGGAANGTAQVIIQYNEAVDDALYIKNSTTTTHSFHGGAGAGGLLRINDAASATKISLNGSANALSYFNTGSSGKIVFGSTTAIGVSKVNIDYDDTVQDAMQIVNGGSITHLWGQIGSGNGRYRISNGGVTGVEFRGSGNNFMLGDTAIGVATAAAKLHVVGSTLLNGNLGLFNTTPIAQPTTGGASAIISTGVGVASKQDDTYGGYTMAQVVQALQNLGALA